MRIESLLVSPKNKSIDREYKFFVAEPQNFKTYKG